LPTFAPEGDAGAAAALDSVAVVVEAVEEEGVEEDVVFDEPPWFVVGSTAFTVEFAALSSFWSTLAFAFALILSMMLWECATGIAVPSRQPVSTTSSHVLSFIVHSFADRKPEGVFGA
jgi:hypothetical protein